jgi:hypothetical protein
MSYLNHNATIFVIKDVAPRRVLQHDTGSFPPEKFW